MKKIILVFAFIVTLFSQNSFAQNSSTSHLLDKYYAIKDALISGNTELALTTASELSKTIATINIKGITNENRKALLSDANNISETKELRKQRGYFKIFSNDFIQLAKTTSLSSEPIYKAYCPMAKANWLSSSFSLKTHIMEKQCFLAAKWLIRLNKNDQV